MNPDQHLGPEEPRERGAEAIEVEKLREELQALRDEHRQATNVLTEAMTLTKSTTHRAFLHDLRNLLNDVVILREVMRARQPPHTAP